MTQEEKAKAYDEALEKAKTCYQGGLTCLEDIFPELKESEDERIRGAIIDHLKDNNLIEWAVWLEKQGTSDPYNGVSFEYNGHTWGMCARDYGVDIVLDKQIFKHLEKQDEKKSTDKVEPKFKVWDWVIDKQGIVHQIANVIENVTCHTYGYDIVGGGYFNDNTEGVRLWTIQDAKDGDVLQLGEVTAIFKKFIGNGNCSCYCSVCNGEFEIPSQDGDGNIYGCHNAVPATKEQRELLFQKMKEAGYEWNEKEKRLIEVPKTKEETGVLKQLIDEVKFSWSEEDEKMFKSLKTLLNNASCYSCTEGVDKILSWLKSLRPQQQWKPSEEQMKAIEHICDGDYKVDLDILDSIYRDFKKLRNE